MNIDLSTLVKKNEVVAVALSGGSDSMALLHYLNSNKTKYEINIIALNVEHGIRGKESVEDTNFVKKYCENNNIPLLIYSVDSISYAKNNNLSIEESARKLRYDCFYDAINSKKCDKVATAHHIADNFESILLNIFRGTGIKGLTGITENYDNKIIRPLIKTKKQEILDYVEKNNLPYVTDSTNLCDDYTRNNFRLNIIPKIIEIFPEAESSVLRLSQIVKQYENYVDKKTNEIVTYKNNNVEIAIPNESILISNATIKAMQYLGLEKDWTKAQADEVVKLASLKTSAKISLPKNIVAIKEYDRICLYVEKNCEQQSIPFGIKNFEFCNKKYTIKKVENVTDLKGGLFADLDKIPQDAVIRTKQDGDIFTKFGGGTKKLNDYLTDKKVPFKDRNSIPVLAKGNIVYLIFEISISEQIKIDKNSRNIVQFG